MARFQGFAGFICPEKSTKVKLLLADAGAFEGVYVGLSSSHEELRPKSYNWFQKISRAASISRALATPIGRLPKPLAGVGF